MVCYGSIVYPPPKIPMLEFRLLVPLNVSVFEGRAFKEINELKCGPSGWALVHRVRDLIRQGDWTHRGGRRRRLDTQRRKTEEDT